MSKCIKCGRDLPTMGECPFCFDQDEKTIITQSKVSPALLKAALALDRRGAGPRAQSMSRIQTPTPAEEFRAFRAPLWRRILAGTTDVTAICSVVALYLLIASSLTHPRASPSSTRLQGLDAAMVFLHAWESLLLPAVGLGVVISLVYSVLFVLAWKGQTPGQRLLGLKLVDNQGAVPTPARAGARAILSLISMALFLGGFWLALFDRKGQTLHDKLTSTFVVKPT